MGKRLIFTVPTVPLAKKRHRTSPQQQCMNCQKFCVGQYRECQTCGGALRFVRNLPFSDSQSVRYENLISYTAQQAMQAGGIVPFVGPTRMLMTFHFPIPASRVCKGQENCCKKDCKRLHVDDYHTQRPDADNCVKSVLDGGNSVLFADDCIIVELSARKLWAAEGKAEIVIEELENV